MCVCVCVCIITFFLKKAKNYVDTRYHSRPMLSFTLGIEPENDIFAKLSISGLNV